MHALGRGRDTANEGTKLALATDSEALSYIRATRQSSIESRQRALPTVAYTAHEVIRCNPRTRRYRLLRGAPYPRSQPALGASLHLMTVPGP